jgi:hypothetical protein
MLPSVLLKVAVVSLPTLALLAADPLGAREAIRSSLSSRRAQAVG